VKSRDLASAALVRELTSALERSGLYARMLEAAARRMTLAAEAADPARNASVGFMTAQVERVALDASSALASLLVESGRVDALARVRAALERTDGPRK
jgi:hypothetical protein